MDDADACNDLIRRYGASLVLYARQWCHLPDDAVQDAFLDFTKLRQLPEDPAAWIFVAVRRKAQNIARHEHRLARREKRMAQSRSTRFLEEVAPEFNSEELATALQCLPDRERQIVVARVWGELTFDQISSVVNLSSSSVHRYYRQALITMGKRLVLCQKPELGCESSEVVD